MSNEAVDMEVHSDENNKADCAKAAVPGFQPAVPEGEITRPRVSLLKYCNDFSPVVTAMNHLSLKDVKEVSNIILRVEVDADPWDEMILCVDPKELATLESIEAPPDSIAEAIENPRRKSVEMPPAETEEHMKTSPASSLETALSATTPESGKSAPLVTPASGTPEPSATTAEFVQPKPTQASKTSPEHRRKSLKRSADNLSAPNPESKKSMSPYLTEEFWNSCNEAFDKELCGLFPENMPIASTVPIGHCEFIEEEIRRMVILLYRIVHLMEFVRQYPLDDYEDASFQKQMVSPESSDASGEVALRRPTDFVEKLKSIWIDAVVNMRWTYACTVKTIVLCRDHTRTSKELEDLSKLMYDIRDVIDNVTQYRMECTDMMTGDSEFNDFGAVIYLVKLSAQIGRCCHRLRTELNFLEFYLKQSL